ncbi:proprotein convertase P-domain-containing protein [Limnofasciculus baicalensis]|uniref:Proprotein convertase P-domain-containing protein n=1 Tax=Limnofasciculus baicalensis BBK-W-15 TaxID=2699891 RepID=A0AAE3GR49_9CYAN|nr:proprotein convertase P-domain-containing protein [Limnofasciculus baicalensis]MCP2729185.1 proprotein convertase P-domain-containing protein [Limnofasciculus baicalensis BBK-W-15]
MVTSTWMKKLSIATAATATCITLGTIGIASAEAATITYTGSGFIEIPENDAAGISSDIVISDTLNISDLTVTLNNLNHTRIGNLIATLSNLTTNTTVTLFDRVGRIEGPPVIPGFNRNFAGNYSFNDSFTTNFWLTAMGRTPATNNTVIPSGNYLPTLGVTGAISPLSAFNGELSQGTWRLMISDNAPLDIGTLDSWTLSMTGTMAGQPVPEPASVVGLLAIGAMGACGLKRKKGQKSEDNNLN